MSFDCPLLKFEIAAMSGVQAAHCSWPQATHANVPASCLADIHVQHGDISTVAGDLVTVESSCKGLLQKELGLSLTHEFRRKFPLCKVAVRAVRLSVDNVQTRLNALAPVRAPQGHCIEGVEGCQRPSRVIVVYDFCIVKSGDQPALVSGCESSDTPDSVFWHL